MQDYLERGKKKRKSNNKFTIISFFSAKLDLCKYGNFYLCKIQ